VNLRKNNPTGVTIGSCPRLGDYLDCSRLNIREGISNRPVVRQLSQFRPPIFGCPRRIATGGTLEDHGTGRNTGIAMGGVVANSVK